MSCENTLSKNFLRQCSYKPKAGLESTVYLANTKEIDKASSQLSTSGMSVSSVVMETGKKIFKAEGAGKFPKGNTELVRGDNGPGWKHGITVRVLYYGEEERAELQKLVDGGRVTAIAEKKDGGTAGELTFDTLGWESGMAVQSVAWNSSENDGVVEIVLGTEEGEEEATDRKVFMDTDLATTRTWLSTNLQA